MVLEFEINKANGTLLSKEGAYSLSRNEVLLLELFYNHPNVIFSNDEISLACWPGRVISPSSVPVAIKRVRDLLKKMSLNSKIITHKGEGYSFSLEDTVTIKFTETEPYINDETLHQQKNNKQSIAFAFAFAFAFLSVILSNLEWNEVSVKYNKEKDIKIITNIVDETEIDFDKYKQSNSVFIDRTHHTIICNKQGCQEK